MAAGHSHCFFPDGSINLDDIPCFPDEGASPCCGVEWTCLTNGICYNLKTTELARGTCTDHAWLSPLCPQFCTKNEYHDKIAINFEAAYPTTWGCSDKWPGEGALMCCEISGAFSPKYNRSCCPGPNAYNLFSIGSKLGTAQSITSSSSSSPGTSSSSPPGISASPLSQYSTSSILNSGPSFSSSSSSGANPGTNGSTIAIATSTSIVAVGLIIASVVMYRRFRRKSTQPSEQVLEVREPVKVYNPQEMPGHQDHELPASQRYLTQELPQLANQIHKP